MNRLIYAASEHDADMLYATRFLAPDAFLYFEKAGRRYAALSQLEFDRGRREARVHEVINQTEFANGLRQRGGKSVAPRDWIAALLRRRRVLRARVGPAFPAGLFDALRKRGIRLEVAEDGLFPDRAVKNRAELACIRQALRTTAALLERAIAMIRASRPRRDGVLMLGAEALTSERVQAAIRMEAARCGYEASHPIVAGGAQACDPHERGRGRLRANEMIILDIFPRNLATGYWGDMTRTVMKGRASDAQRRQFEAVHGAQRLAISELRAGVNGATVHRNAERFFREKGYATGNTSGRYEGFFHGTGHGIGLEIHENPRVSVTAGRLRKGNVVTVEPALYYPKVGGVRIEDVVVIQAGGCDPLSRFPIQLEI